MPVSSLLQSEFELSIILIKKFQTTAVSVSSLLESLFELSIILIRKLQAISVPVYSLLEFLGPSKLFILIRKSQPLLCLFLHCLSPYLIYQLL